MILSSSHSRQEEDSVLSLARLTVVLRLNQHLPITLPVTFLMCCGQILGCRGCVDTAVATWNRCPLCQEDGLSENSCVVRGSMDDFMNIIHPYLFDLAN